MASRHFELSVIATISNANAENVVKPPRNPATISRLIQPGRLNREIKAHIMPIARHPIRLQAIVLPVLGENRVLCCNRKRHIAPDAKRVPRKNFHTGSSGRLHMCMQRMLLHETEHIGKTIQLPAYRVARSKCRCCHSRTRAKTH